MSYKNPTGGKKGKRKHHGGTSTGEYATKVYGGIDGQHAGPGGSIAMNQVAGGDPVMGIPGMKGGAPVKSVGGNVMSDVAVPAALLYANHRYSRGRVAYGRRFINRSSKRRSSRRMSRRKRTFRRRR